MGEPINIEEYLASGQLEAYVLGALSEAEAQDVAEKVAAYPELQREVAEIEEALGKYAEPASEPGSHILSALAEIDTLDSPKSTPVIKPFWKFAAAAAIVLLLASIFLNISFYQQLRKQANSLMVLETELREEKEKKETLLAFYEEENVSIWMKGLDISPESKARVIWNPVSGQVFLANQEFPIPPEGFQYQLWAIIDGRPVSAGLFSREDPSSGFMTSIEGTPTAFAVTLEPEGGNELPTLEQMYVYGELDSA